MIMNQDIPLSLSAIAARIGITVHALYPYVHEGLLRTFKIGSLMVATPQDAEAFIAAHAVGKFDARRKENRR